PVHVSFGSQTSPEPGRHTVVEGLKTADRRAGTERVQDSATSHGPTEARHSKVLGRNPSAGQAAPAEPVQDSATSHTPADARHPKSPGFTTSAGQLAPVPVHVSFGSHTSPEPSRHTVVEGL